MAKKTKRRDARRKPWQCLEIDQLKGDKRKERDKYNSEALRLGVLRNSNANESLSSWEEEREFGR